MISWGRRGVVPRQFARCFGSASMASPTREAIALANRHSVTGRLAGIPVRDYDSVFENVTGKISVEALRPSSTICCPS